MRTRKHPAVTRPSIDFPTQGERICSPRYTLRLSVPRNAKSVDVCIDQGSWRACREWGGHWWYDWSGYEDGEHEVVVRVTTRDDLAVTSEPHEFFVDLAPHHEEANA